MSWLLSIILIINRYEQKKLVAVTDLLGRPTKIIKNKVLLYIYSDGTVIRKVLTK